MPKQLQLDLTDKQRAELVDLRDHADQPYLRERAAALLKIADGDSARQVAAHGLLRKRWYHTLAVWLKRYEQDGVEGMKIKSGRGRKPAFSPSAQNCSGGQRRASTPGHSRA